MSDIRYGIVGSGMIAGVMVKAINAAENATLVGVASRDVNKAKAFADEQGIPQVFENWQVLVQSDDIDAVYVATPTANREEVALAAIANNKHVIAEKPFATLASVERMVKAAEDQGVAFMDATHFSHNPRTTQVQESTLELIGEPKSIHTSFFFPFMDRSNIRFNPEKEPTGAVGDMAWYSMRAVVEYLNTKGEVKSVSGAIERDEETQAVIRGSGLMTFADNKTTTFVFGYNSGVCLMDLDLLGEEGMVHIDDFVLDWKHGFAFDNADHVVGYQHRSGMQSPKEVPYIAADSNVAQSTLLIQQFSQGVTDGDQQKEWRNKALLTQKLLDQFWQSVA